MLDKNTKNSNKLNPYKMLITLCINTKNEHIYAQMTHHYRIATELIMYAEYISRSVHQRYLRRKNDNLTIKVTQKRKCCDNIFQHNQ